MTATLHVHGPSLRMPCGCRAQVSRGAAPVEGVMMTRRCKTHRRTFVGTFTRGRLPVLLVRWVER